jgi:phosphoserine aminotransferase
VYLLRNVLAELKSGVETVQTTFIVEREPFSTGTLNTSELEAEFLAEAKKRGMEGLKGHRSVGGFRASIYNAVSLEWVSALADLVKGFKK